MSENCQCPRCDEDKQAANMPTFDRLAVANADHKTVSTNLDIVAKLNREMGFNICKITMLNILSMNTQLQFNPVLYASVLGSLAGLSYER